MKKISTLALWAVTYVVLTLGCADLILSLAVFVEHQRSFAIAMIGYAGLATLMVGWALTLTWRRVIQGKIFAAIAEGAPQNAAYVIGALGLLGVIYCLTVRLQSYYWQLITPQTNTWPNIFFGGLLALLILGTILWHGRSGAPAETSTANKD